MDLKILLDSHCPQLYGPGSVVSGKVVLNYDPKREETVDSVTVTLLGDSASKVVWGQSHHNGGKIILFSFSQELYRGPGTYSAAVGRAEWPFQFAFPSVTPKSQFVETQPWEKTDRWPFGPGSPLPPSFNFDDLGINDGIHCYIRYCLEARLVRGQGRRNMRSIFSTSNVVSRCVLWFSPARSVQSPLIRHRSDTFERTFQVFPEPNSPWMNVKQKVQSAFLADDNSIPKSTFRFTIRLPDAAIRNTQLPIFLKTEYIPETSTADAIPPITLVRVTLSVNAHTRVRAESEFSGVHEASTRTKNTLSNQRPLDIPLRPGEPALNLGRLLDLRIRSLPVDFVYYNIRRIYSSMHLKATVRCAGKDHELHSSISRIRVMSPIYLGEISYDGSSLPPRADGQHTDTEGLVEYLPPYPGSGTSIDEENEEGLPAYEP